jgi:CTP:phosphocholine cytidylyltransferase-like protein
MGLSGINLVYVSDSERKKIEETIKTMKETRIEDTIKLRKIIDEKIAYLKEQYNNAINVENNLKSQLKKLSDQKLRIEGALSSLNNILKKAENK